MFFSYRLRCFSTDNKHADIGVAPRGSVGPCPPTFLALNKDNKHADAKVFKCLFRNFNPQPWCLILCCQQRCMGGKWSFVSPELQHFNRDYVCRLTALDYTAYIAKTKVQVSLVPRLHPMLKSRESLGTRLGTSKQQRS